VANDAFVEQLQHAADEQPITLPLPFPLQEQQNLRKSSAPAQSIAIN
jgi:hypothetical protein